MNKTTTQLSASGLSSAQILAIRKAFPDKPDKVAKIGTADATDLASAIALANATKARLNALIDALKA